MSDVTGAGHAVDSLMADHEAVALLIFSGNLLGPLGHTWASTAVCVLVMQHKL
jgi:hypothetical protein